ncbi:MAG: YfhO family protein [Peptostreptococcus sp.]|uniref:YfhO family protein n=1 Tax=Peptostreptococcus sp. TaxID=1262 RepID=UPI002FC77419
MERKKTDKILIYLYYTLGFAVLAGIIVTIFYMNNKSLVYNSDALVQHYPTQFYLSDFFANLFSGAEKFNFNLGLGQDVMATYHYYGLTDPLNILLGIFSWVDPNLLYYISLGLRMYLAGIAFVYMCIHFQKNNKAIALGALIYTFSNYSLSGGLMHPYFVNAMILMPLMIVGVDKMIRYNKVTFFIVVSTLSIFMNVYFSYIIAILAFVYAIVSILFQLKKIGFSKTMILFGRGIISYIISVMIAGAVLLPVAYGFLNSYRNQSLAYDIPLVVGGEDFIHYFMDMFKAPNISSFVMLGISVVTLFAIISLFSNKGNKKIKILFFLLILLITVPKLQSAITGFSYDNYRWYFVVELMFAYIFVDQFENLLNMDSFRKNILRIILIAYMGMYIYVEVNTANARSIDLKSKTFLANMLPVLITIAIMFILSRKSGKIKRSAFSIMIFVALGINMGVYGYDALKQDVLMDFSQMDKILQDDTLKAVSKTTKGTLDRVDNSDQKSMNFSDIFGYPSSSVYYSIENKNLSKFNMVYRNAKASPITRVHNFDSRAILDDIMSVKYYVKGNDDRVPYGFVNVGHENLYINKNYIPFGFTYENYIKPYEVASLSTLDMQEAMMRACLIEDNIGDVKHLNSGVLSDIKLKGRDLEVKSDLNGKVTAGSGYNVDIECDVPNDGELYIKLPDVDSIKGVERIYLTNGKSYSTIDLTKPSSKWYTGEKDVIINAGFVKKGHRKLTLNLPTESEFIMEDISLELREMNVVDEYSKELGKEHLEDLELLNNGFTGNISNEGNKLMFISIPYDKGWSAKIDGVESKIYKANVGFMAVKLEPGEHTVEFKYDRPYQSMGYIVSILGIILFILYKIKRVSIKEEEEYTGKHSRAEGWSNNDEE